jgi:hypothetical protein
MPGSLAREVGAFGICVSGEDKFARKSLLRAAGSLGYISSMAEHDHDHNKGSNLSDVELRVRALETI